MACFIAPAAEAIVMTIVSHYVKKKEQEEITMPETAGVKSAELADTANGRIPFSRKLSWLTNLLWGGSFLLLIEHIWHGEIVMFPPFLTAMQSKGDAAAMLIEIATAGVAMALLCTLVWCGMLVVSRIAENRNAKRGIEECA